MKHTGCPQGWVSRPLHVTGSEIIVHLPASLWLLSPISRAPLCLLPCLPSTGLCERLCLLASPVPTRFPLGSREARIQERGLLSVQFSSVQFSRSLVSDSVIPWTAARQASRSITNSRSLPKLMSIESVMPSNHLILCCPLLLPPSLFPSFRVFSDVSALHIRWPKYWSFSFNISPSNERLVPLSVKIS